MQRYSKVNAAKSLVWSLLQHYGWIRRGPSAMTPREAAFVEAAMQDDTGVLNAQAEDLQALATAHPELVASAGGAALTAAFIGRDTDDMVRLLVAQGARFEYDVNEWSPIHHAAHEISRLGSTRFARFHAVFAADIAQATEIAVKSPRRGARGNRTLLHATSTYGHAELTELLLNHGADAVLEHRLGRNGRTALQNATAMAHSRRNRERTARVLLAHGAYYDIFSACARNDTERLRELLHKDREAAQQRDGDGQTPLHWAAWCCALDCLELLIQAGASVNAKANNGKAPLHLAAGPVDVPQDLPLPDNTRVVAALIRAGAALDSPDNRNRTPLHHASYRGYADAAELLIDAGADVTLRNRRGRAPLEIARKDAARLRRPPLATSGRRPATSAAADRSQACG